MKEFEPYLSVFFLIFSCFLEESANLNISLFDCLGRIIEILGMSLRLTGKCGLEILLSFRAFQFCHNT